MMTEIQIDCSICPNTKVVTIELGDGWGNAENVYYEKALCPDHIAIEPFIDNQCRGCVGGWRDCNLWRGFAHRDRRDLTERDFEVMRQGRCPRRTNGSMTFNSHTGELTRGDYSSLAPEAGIALEKAIKDYWARYD